MKTARINPIQVKFALAVALVILCSNSVRSEVRHCSSDWLNYEPSQVSLEGVVSKENYYGPPGYGEDKLHDKLETTLLLNLRYGINVAANQSDELNDQISKCETLIQVILPAEIPSLVLGKRVKISGTLFVGHTGYHITNVVLNANAVSYTH